MVLRILAFFIFICFSFGVGTASAQTCESLFLADGVVVTPLAQLTVSREEMLEEQRAVRNRIWTPAQVREISQKGRLEFESLDRAVRYYRGLLAWKIQLLTSEIRTLKETDQLARGEKEWPVDLFSNRTALKTVLRAMDLTLANENPNAQQIAALLVVRQNLRKLEMGFGDRSTIVAANLKLLTESFPEIFKTADSSSLVEKLSKALLEAADEKNCCARGDCPGCTHPNVVFRNQNVSPGPVYMGPAVASTLPLYRIMDRLKQAFPKQVLGANFWDFKFDT